MTDRQRRILASLVAEYIDEGEPISSAWLAEHSALGLSSATVRNILARLEEQGMVRQPHTSAGRVPTDSGYRLYVDLLLGGRRRPKAHPEFEARLRLSGTVGELLENASQELSRASHQIGFALSPAGQTVRLQHIDFVNLDGRRVLVIVVAAGRPDLATASSKPRSATPRRRWSRPPTYINREFAGLTLDEARAAIVERMRQERMLYDALMARALRLAKGGLDRCQPEERLHVQGTSYLIDELAGEGTDRQRTLETLRALFRMLEEKHRLVELLSRSIEAGGLTVVIGSENLFSELHPFSLVLSTFQDGDRTGTIGVIGPTRMRYQRAISVVDGVSHAVSRLFEGQ